MDDYEFSVFAGWAGANGSFFEFGFPDCLAKLSTYLRFFFFQLLRYGFEDFYGFLNDVSFRLFSLLDFQHFFL